MTRRTYRPEVNPVLHRPLGYVAWKLNMNLKQAATRGLRSWLIAQLATISEQNEDEMAERMRKTLETQEREFWDKQIQKGTE